MKVVYVSIFFAAYAFYFYNLALLARIVLNLFACLISIL